MPGSDVDLKMTGDAAKVIAEMTKLTGRIDDVRKGLQGVADTAKKAKKIAEEQAAAQNKATKAIEDAIKGYLGTQAALAAVNNELRLKDELEQKSINRKVTLSAARDVLHGTLDRNMPAEERQKIIDRGTEIAKKAKVDEKYIDLAIAEGLSSSGGNVEGTMKAVTGAAEFLRSSPQDIQPFVGSLLDLSKVTGTDDAAVNQGYLAYVGQISRVNDPRMMAMNIPGGLINAKTFGATPKEAASAYAALTVGAADIRGATSATGLTALSQQLKDFLPNDLSVVDERAIAAAKAKKPRKQTEEDKAALELEKRSKLGLDTFGKRLQYLQQNQDMAEEFLAGASFEKTVLGPITDLLMSPESETAKQFAANMKGIPSNAELAKSVDQMLGAMNADALAPVANAQRGFEAAVGQLELANPTLGIRQRTIEALQASGDIGATGGFIHSMVMQGSEFLGQDPAATAESYLNQAISNREASKWRYEQGIPFAPAPTAESEKQLEVLKDLRDEIIGLRRDNARGLQAPAENAHNEG